MFSVFCEVTTDWNWHTVLRWQLTGIGILFCRGESGKRFSETLEAIDASAPRHTPQGSSLRFRGHEDLKTPLYTTWWVHETELVYWYLFGVIDNDHDKMGQRMQSVSADIRMCLADRQQNNREQVFFFFPPPGSRRKNYPEIRDFAFHCWTL
jgi:hypothetical protein